MATDEVMEAAVAAYDTLSHIQVLGLAPGYQEAVDKAVDLLHPHVCEYTGIWPEDTK